MLNRTISLATRAAQGRLGLPVPSDPDILAVKFGDGTSFSYTVEHFGVGGSDDVLSQNNSKPKLLLLHGGPGSHRDWRFLSGALKELQEDLPWLEIPSIIRVDLPGHGQSSRGQRADAKDMIEVTMRGLKTGGVEGPVSDRGKCVLCVCVCERK